MKWGKKKRGWGEKGGGGKCVCVWVKRNEEGKQGKRWRQWCCACSCTSLLERTSYDFRRFTLTYDSNLQRERGEKLRTREKQRGTEGERERKGERSHNKNLHDGSCISPLSCDYPYFLYICKIARLRACMDVLMCIYMHEYIQSHCNAPLRPRAHRTREKTRHWPQACKIF